MIIIILYILFEKVLLKQNKIIIIIFLKRHFGDGRDFPLTHDDVYIKRRHRALFGGDVTASVGGICRF